MLCTEIIDVYLENTRRNINDHISAVRAVHHVRNYLSSLNQCLIHHFS
jgi:hypothetical protein